MTTAKFESIRDLPLFAGMAEESFGELVRGAFVQTFPPNMVMISEGDTPDFLHIMQDGCVELFSTWNKHETSVATLYANSTFILAATIKDRPNLMSARTLEKSRIIMVPSENVRSVFMKDTAFAFAIVDELARCYRATIKNMKNLKLRSSLERLANYVLKHHHRNGDALEFRLPIEKRRLASYLGMTPENLSRAFNSLKPHGVTVNGQMIAITDLDALKAFAKPDLLID